MTETMRSALRSSAGSPRHARRSPEPSPRSPDPPSGLLTLRPDLIWPAVIFLARCREAPLRIFEHQYGRAPEQPEEPLVIPDNIEDMEKLSWGQLLYLAGEHADAGINQTGSPSLSK